ncbi:Rna exonuclease [Thalictrum thalictroides]|uniref:Rna exonuclease n=1 Tax=Thalictrum thalictroides TaxID=46969 RepID=A0A7J6X1X1_THATH|nr:Rna exonuclease [Thalictrum thalictroides]
MAGKAVMEEMAVVRSEPPVPGKAAEVPTGPIPVSWSALFQGNASKLKTTLNYFKPNLVDGVAEVPNEVIEQGQKEWEDYLVGSFVGKRLPFPLVKDALQKQWKTQKFDMVADEDVFYFKFHTEEDKQMVLDKGPVFIAGRLFIVRFWTPENEKGKKLISSVPIWVNLEGVPKRLWSEEGLGFLASLIGKPVCLDDATAKKSRLKFARVCIEVDLDCSFPKVVKANMRGEVVEIKVEYNWIPSKCTKCSSFGHLTNRCVKKVTTSWKKSDGGGPSCIRNSQGKEIFNLGDTTNETAFKVVERRSSPNSPIVNGGATVVAANTMNRFDCLQQEDEVEEEGLVSETIIHKEQETEVRAQNNEVEAQMVEVEAQNGEKEVQCAEVALGDDTSENTTERHEGINLVSNNSQEPVNIIIADDNNQTESILVVGDATNECHGVVNVQEETEEFTEDVPETPYEDVDKYYNEKEMYDTLVDEVGNGSDPDLEEEEVEVFKDHLVKESPSVIPPIPKIHRNLKREAQAKAQATAEKKVEGTIMKRGRSKGSGSTISKKPF